MSKTSGRGAMQEMDDNPGGEDITLATCENCGGDFDTDAVEDGWCIDCREQESYADEEESLDYDGTPLRFKCEGSALRAASESNPRNLPCPNCGAANRLTPKDKALGYQCDSCADRAERGADY